MVKHGSKKVAVSFVDGNCIAPSGGGTQQILPMLASSGNTIFAQWQGRISSLGSCGGYFTLGTWATYFSSSSNWGQTWSSPSRVGL